MKTSILIFIGALCVALQFSSFPLYAENGEHEMRAEMEQQMAEQQMLASQMASEVDKNVADAEAKRRIN